MSKLQNTIDEILSNAGKAKLERDIFIQGNYKENIYAILNELKQKELKMFDDIFSIYIDKDENSQTVTMQFGNIPAITQKQACLVIKLLNTGKIISIAVPFTFESDLSSLDLPNKEIHNILASEFNSEFVTDSVINFLDYINMESIIINFNLY